MAPPVELIAAVLGILSALSGLAAAVFLFRASRKAVPTQAALDGLDLLDLTAAGQAADESRKQVGGDQGEPGVRTAKSRKDLIEALFNDRREAGNLEKWGAILFMLTFLLILAQSAFLVATLDGRTDCEEVAETS